MENKEAIMKAIKDLKSIKDEEFINKCIEFVEEEIENVYSYTNNEYYRPVIVINKKPVGNDKYISTSVTLDYLNNDNILYKYIPKEHVARNKDTYLVIEFNIQNYIDIGIDTLSLYYFILDIVYITLQAKLIFIAFNDTKMAEELLCNVIIGCSKASIEYIKNKIPEKFKSSDELVHKCAIESLHETLCEYILKIGKNETPFIDFINGGR